MGNFLSLHYNDVILQINIYTHSRFIRVNVKVNGKRKLVHLKKLYFLQISWNWSGLVVRMSNDQMVKDQRIGELKNCCRISQRPKALRYVLSLNLKSF